MSSPDPPLPGLMQSTPLTIDMVFRRMRDVFFDTPVSDAESTSTYGMVAERIERLAGALVDLGIGPGDRVATFGFNSIRHLELYYAVPLVGAVLHTVNVRLFPDQVSWIINHAEDVALFHDAELADTVTAIAPELPTVRTWVQMGGDRRPPGHLDHDELVANGQPRTRPVLDEETAFGLCYTSGTTGDPKGVLYSHRAMTLHSFAAAMHDHIGLGERDVVFPVVPMFHAFAWGLPYAAPFVGAELVLHGSDSSPDHLAARIRDRQVTVAAGVPTIWKSLLPALQSGDLEADSLRLVFVGGSASPRALIEAYDDLDIPYLQIWGMTETGPLACASRPRRRHRDLDRDATLAVREKTGTIFAGLEARVTNPDGTEAKRDGATVGELEVRGPWISSGYYRTEAVDRFNQGWLRTGDMATMERDGYFRIVDRAKDLVKSGGEWISSVELEGHLLAHPLVADAAVIGVPSRRWDERPVAVVVPRDPGDPPDLADLRSFLSERVASWWLPDAVRIVEAIPKTSVGKLDKKVLRDQVSIQLD